MKVYQQNNGQLDYVGNTSKRMRGNEGQVIAARGQASQSTIMESNSTMKNSSGSAKSTMVLA